MHTKRNTSTKQNQKQTKEIKMRGSDFDQNLDHSTNCEIASVNGEQSKEQTNEKDKTDG
jgi:hypothetical protein